GRHRAAAPSHLPALATAAGVSAVAASSLFTGTAAAADNAPGPNWDAIAQCESSGNWAINTGTGFYGGLQFTMSTWHANGGVGNPANASREQQISVAQRVLSTQGIGAWPVCGKHARDNSPARPAIPVAPAAPVKPVAPVKPAQPPAPAAPAPAPTGPTWNYTARSGDTLWSIAVDHQVPGGWQRIYDANRDTLTDPDLILAGQSLRIPQ
ncbi:MAG: transglycosylase family protein, partial [Pseudonocardiaceae bacterium]